MVTAKKRVHGLCGSVTLGGELFWNLEHRLAWPEREDEAFVIRLYCRADEKPEFAQRRLAKELKNNGVTWLWRDRTRWFFDANAMRRSITNATDFPWIIGVVEAAPKIEEKKGSDDWWLVFEFTEEFMNEARPKRIFLSHKGTDKALVREFHRALKAIGFDPWLDEDALTAGANLERALLKGIKDSCAAVFFLTESYKDAGYLATEVEYAISEKRAKSEKFAIISLVLDSKATVPDLLKGYVWKTPNSSLDGLCEILRALPLKLPPPEWKS